jgi:hypothetical protein
VNKVLIAVAVVFAATFANGQQAFDKLPTKSDLKTVNCKDLFDRSPTVTVIVLAYLQAHYRAKDAPPVLDTEKMAADGLKLQEHCDAHPQLSVLDAADELFGMRL